MNEARENEELYREMLRQNAWNTILTPLPENPTPLILKEAHIVADYCYEAALDRLENPGIPMSHAFDPDRREFPGYFQAGGSAEFAEAALQRLEELERLDPTLLRVGPHSEHFAEQMRLQEERLNSSRDEDAPQEREEDIQDRSDPADTANREVEESDRMERFLDEDGSAKQHDEDMEALDFIDQPELSGPGFDRGGR